MSHRLPPIQPGHFGEEIGFNDVRTIAKRFKRLHELKKDNVRHILSASQRQFLDALPLILNMNHPALPGFVSAATPAGIYAYQADKRALDAARQINRSFSYQPGRSGPRQADIDGVFLMGSVGSIAFTKASDIDIWLCHRSDLSAQALGELAKKTQALENWAASLQLEVHFFLINSAQFLHDNKYPVSVDSCGETQHYLLLEEFYRTSVYVAGKLLAWWLVPPEREPDYEDYLADLLRRHAIKAEQILDLGSLAKAPAGEFISATQWHIYKALQSPYKSLLKLALLECYASEFPYVHWLCNDIKGAVYRGMLSGLELDPYVQLYRRLERYLLHSPTPNRLAMIRQIFCRKVTEAAGDHRQMGALSPYEDYFRELSENWRWPNNPLQTPCARNLWDIEKVLAENTAIIAQLTHCHDRIVHFAQVHVDPDFQESRDMKLLGNKLAAFFSHKPGKIEITTTRDNNVPIKPSLSIVETRAPNGDSAWHLFFGKKTAQSLAQSTPLYSRPSLIEMLCWLTVNGFYRPDIPVHCSCDSLTLMPNELSAALYGLRDFFKRRFNCADALCNYEGDNTLTHACLLVNLGHTTPEQAAGPYLLSTRANPLSHGAQRECLVRAVDAVTLSRWNEVQGRHAEGCAGLFDSLIDIVENAPHTASASMLGVACRTPGYAHGIIRCIEQLFAGLLELKRGAVSRYLAEAGKRFAMFDNDSGNVRYQWYDDEQALIDALSAPRRQFGTPRFDDGALADTPLPTLYRESKPYLVQCFFYREQSGVTAYVLDEKGSLFCRRHPDADIPALLLRHAQFLAAVLRLGETEAEAARFFELQRSPAGAWSCLPLAIPQPLPPAIELPVPALAARERLQTLHFLARWDAGG